jgi:two-component system OmpR family sensor kinase
MSLRSQSLRTRLVAIAVVLVTFGVLATSAATYFALRGFLFAQLDADVRDAADHAGALLFPPPRLGRGPNERVGKAELAVAFADGTVLAAPVGDGDAGLSITPAQAAQVIAASGPVSLRTSGGEVFRATMRPLRNGTGTIVSSSGETTSIQLVGAQLIVGLPAGGLDTTLGKLLGLEVIVGAIVVVGAGVLSAAGVRLGLRPLDRVTRTARAVAAELSPDGSGLDRRVEVTDPDTEVGQLAEAVNTMLDAVETEYAARYESEQRMRRFLADASHELRTPLTSLRGYAELIRLRGKEGTDAEARDALRRIEAEGTRMSRLVDDLLTLARYDRGAIPEWAPVALTDVVADAVAGVHAAHPERTITMVDPGTPATVLGDRDQLLQVVRNVLTNAATHTEDGPITVTVSTVDSSVEVVVRDTGPGLQPEQAARVFDRFWRADVARTRIRGGSGLGLSIVQALLAGHGGRVGFDSSPADGTTVTIRLPAAPPPSPGITPRAAASPAAPDRRVDIGRPG